MASEAAQKWIRSGSVIGGGVRGSSVISDGVSGSGIFPTPLSLVTNLHLIVRLELDSTSTATKASMSDLTAASNDGGIRPITIPIPSGGSGGSGTGRGDSGGGTVGEA